MAAKFTVKGADKLIAKLRHLQKRSTASKVLRRAVNAGTTPILQAARANCPVDEGDLKKSMAKKVISRGLSMNGIVGADAGYVGAEPGKRLSKEEAASAGDDAERPAKYDHLVEYGHATPDGKAVPPHAFLRPAWDSWIGAAQEKYQQALASGIEAEAMKG